MTTAMATKYNYRRRLPHFQYDDKPLFITFGTFGHMLLRPAARDLMLKHCLHDHGSKYMLHAAVIMPEHVHLLLSPLRDAAGYVFPLQQILQSIKGASAHSINKAAGRQGPVWEEESFDHVLRSYESLEEKLEYIRQNPVRRRLARRPEHYRWLWVAPKIV
ncbi:MAG TPA: transposase [Terriglobales bacterium]|nr:transposase [Terriglobales bacterium]